MIEEKTRKCNGCGEEKTLEEFPKDKTKKEGFGYTCKKCQREYKKKKRSNTSKTFGHKRYKEQYPECMMAESAFKKYYYNAELRTFVVTSSIRYAKHNYERQLDFRQIAWLHISMCEEGKDIDHYKKVAKRAIYNEYYRQLIARKYNLSYEETMSKNEVHLWKHGVEL
jgi:hypothetical protein